ncbi:UxaA family hydrolase [Candidatus Latescibacterota bacterium]
MKEYTALLLDQLDNVATLLSDVPAGNSVNIKGKSDAVSSVDTIEISHKIAIVEIMKGADIIKYGQRIGVATMDIMKGQWIHLHNMESSYDTEFKKRVSL